MARIPGPRVNTRVREQPNAQALIDHFNAYLTGCMNAEAGEEALKALKRARAAGHTALDAALLDIFRSYTPSTVGRAE